jgi:serine/threonine-protein kinase
MTADEPTPGEELYTALFAAGEEAVAAGQEPRSPTAAPPELRSRLEHDLACVQVLHRALARPASAERAPSPAATIAPPPARTPEAVPVALAIGLGRESASDIRALLHKRLRLGGLLLSGYFTYYTIVTVRRIVLDPGSLRENWFHYAVLWLALLGTALLSGVLWGKRCLSLRRLRVIELALLGIVLADMAWLLYYDLVLVGQLARFYQMGRTVGEAEDLVHLYACGWSLAIFVVIVAYATLIPSDWRRCTLVVSTMALVPLTVITWGGLLTLPSPSTALFYLTTPMVIFLSIAVVIAAMGTHRIEMLRQAAAHVRKLGQYQLKQRLGAGGMGEVYLAEHLLLKQPCAVKLIRPERAGDAAVLRRFEREVQATARLKHWNTVQIFDYGHAADGTFYYVMEYLPGPTLEQLVKHHGPLPAERAVHLLRQMCLALREAHAMGLIHRDLKPANIMLCERGGIHDVVKLLDFGLVKAVGLGSQEDKLTQEGAIAGTPAYMSPEQASGKDHLDARTDIYSLGAVAYFLLTGHPPFRGNKAIQLIVAHIQEQVRPLTDLRPDVPGDVQGVVLRCLEKDAARRFAEVTRLHEALAACACAGQWTEEMAAQWWQVQAEQGNAGTGAEPLLPAVTRPA